MNEKIKLHRMEAGDGNALLALISELRRKAVAEGGVDVIIASCFEAGRDGFWLHRLLLAHGVINHVVEPTSILVTRGARRAKTDRLDAQAAAACSRRDIHRRSRRLPRRQRAKRCGRGRKTPASRA